MSSKLKQGFTMPLYLRMKGITDWSVVEKIDLIFSQTMSMDSTRKYATYYPDGSGEVQREEDSDVLIVPFTPTDTRLFSDKFFMDAKIKLFGTDYNPYVEIKQLQMSPTLFKRSDDDDYD